MTGLPGLLACITAGGGLALGLWWGMRLGEWRVYRRWRGRLAR